MNHFFFFLRELLATIRILGFLSNVIILAVGVLGQNYGWVTNFKKKFVKKILFYLFRYELLYRLLYIAMYIFGMNIRFAIYIRYELLNIDWKIWGLLNCEKKEKVVKLAGTPGSEPVPEKETNSLHLEDLSFKS